MGEKETSFDHYGRICPFYVETVNWQWYFAPCLEERCPFYVDKPVGWCKRDEK